MLLTFRTSRFLLILLGLMLAVCVMYKFKHELTNDRDGYLALAQKLDAGNRFVDPVTNRPTAYRPPIYPMLLKVALTFTDSAALAVACINGIALFYLMQLLRRFKPEIISYSGASSFAALGSQALFNSGYFQLILMSLVIFDPLTLFYVTQPMTEVVSSLCTMMLLYLLLNIPWLDVHFENRQSLDLVLQRLQQLGFAFGLAIVLRPTFLIMFLGVIAWLISGYLTGKFKIFLANKWGLFVVVNLSLLLVIFPMMFWGLRNSVELNHFIITTTHGGYTLSLANNEAFYKTVVDSHPLKVWELPDEHPDSQQVWWRNLQLEMGRKGLEDEVSRDKYLSAQAFSFILDNPGRFMKACLYRVFWFWSPVPLTNHTDLPWFILWGIILFYTVENICCFIVMGMIIWRREFFTIWGLCMVMILSYEFLHLFYWTNARMRVPVIPLIAILAARTIVLFIQPKTVRENNSPQQIPVAP